MLLRYSNLNFLFYLNNYDLVNKYFFFNYYVIPRITAASLFIFFKGFFNFKLFRKYVLNFLLLYFFCFNFAKANILVHRFKTRRVRVYKAKLFLNYCFMKKKLLLTTLNLFFLLCRFVRPYFFSIQNLVFSSFGGKLLFVNIKIITHLSQVFFLDNNERRYFTGFKHSKIFLTFNVCHIFTVDCFNFNQSLVIPRYFSNLLFFWCFI